MCCERKRGQNRAMMIFVSSRFKGNFNQQHLSALVRVERVESLNASAETSASSGKKIYARRWRERKKISVCTRRVSRRIERDPKGKEDVQKADGGRERENWKRTRTRGRGHDDGGLKGSGSAKKRWANKMHSYISGVCQNKWRCFVGDLFGPPPKRLWSSPCAETIRNTRSMRHN